MTAPRKRTFRFPWRTERDITRGVDTELQFHLEMRTAELVAGGMSQEAAREYALREFGDLEYTRQYCRGEDRAAEREDRWRDRLDEIAGHVTYALRSFRRSPGFATVAILTIALVIGANTSIFSVANAVLLAPPPYGDPGRLVALYENNVPNNRLQSDMSAADLVDYREMQHTLSGIGVLSSGGVVMRVADAEPIGVGALRVSANMFDVLQARPALGRTFAADEDTPGKNRVVILSTSLWRSALGGDSSAVGRYVTINDAPHLIIGVMPPGFGLGYREELWIPLDLAPMLADVNRSRKMHWLYAVGRLKPGTSLDLARSDLSGAARTLESRHPDENRGHLITVMPLQAALAGNSRNATLILSAAAGLVLLIACLNLGNLMLARAVARRRELVVRAAIGASRSQLVRQLLTECLVLTGIGGAAGVAIAAIGTPFVVRMSAGALPATAQVHVDWRVLTFSLFVSLAMGVLMGLLPAFAASRLDLNASLKETTRGAAGDRSGYRVRKALVVTQVAMAVVLLVVAGLLVRSFETLRRVDLGFQPEGAIAMNVSVRGPKYGTLEGFNQFYDALFEQLRATPGIVAVGAVSNVPLVGSSGCGLAIDGAVLPPDVRPEVRCLAARGDYFQAIGTPLLEGRHFNEQDRPDGPQVTMINAAMAKQYFPGASPLGRRIRLGPNPTLPWMTIVGVVADQRQSDMESEPKPTAFEYDPQHGWGSLGIVARTTGNPRLAAPAMRAAVRAVDPTLAVRSVRTMEEIVGISLASRRFSLNLIAGFAILALVLAAVGIYGVLAFIVSARTREYGIRMALGARAGTVRIGVLQGGLAWTGLGVAIGAVVAFVAGRSLEAMLYRVPPSDPMTFAGVGAVVIVVATVACVVPAHRATRVDPLTVMRE